MYFRLLTPLFLILSVQVSAISAENFQRLIKGNDRFISDTLEHPNRSSDRRDALISKQNPFAVVVSCSDSRVAPEILFDQGIGDLFIVRVAGNVIGPLELESIKYAVFHLGASLILVMGHENCGAVEAVMQGQTTGIEALATLIEPAVKSTKNDKAVNPLEAAIKANAQNMVTDLLKLSAIQELVKAKKLKVAAGYYNLQSGAVDFLN